MFPFKQVILLQVFLKFEIDLCDRELKSLRRALGPGIQPCMHEKRHLAFVIVTREEPAELVQRLSRVLEVDNIEDWTAGIMLGGCVGKHGGMNSFVTKINWAYGILQNGPAKYLRESQTLIKPDFRQRAPREMRVEGRRDR
ncbi:MAG: hypothetical protein WDZ83_06315 [Rhizobiaceae bacterium]